MKIIQADRIFLPIEKENCVYYDSNVIENEFCIKEEV